MYISLIIKSLIIKGLSNYKIARDMSYIVYIYGYIYLHGYLQNLIKFFKNKTTNLFLNKLKILG